MLPNRTNTILVCLIEQNRLAADYLFQLLTKDLLIRAVYPEGLTNGNLARTAGPIFLVDNCGLALPVSDCLQKLRFRYPAARFIVLDQNRSNENILRLLLLGVHGFLAHYEASRDLLSAVHTVAEGRMHIPPEVLREGVQSIATARENRHSGPHPTTLRENQVVELARRRLSNKEIAQILKIRESTVKYHLSNVFSKLQITTRHALVEEYERGRGDWPPFLLSKAE